MGSKTSQQLYEEHLEKGTPIENLLRVMVNRADRYQNYYNSMKNRVEVYEKQYDELLRNTGRLITTKVDHIAQDAWGHTYGTGITNTAGMVNTGIKQMMKVRITTQGTIMVNLLWIFFFQKKICQKFSLVNALAVCSEKR